MLSGFGLLAQSSSVGSNAVVSRFASITDYSALKKQTLDDRYYENGIALQRIRAHPVGGLGWGPDYGAVLLSSDDGFVITRPRSFMHQQYLWIWMRAGIIGLLCSDRRAGLRRLERRALVSSAAWKGRCLAGSRHRRIAGRRGGQLERGDLPHATRLDRAPRRRARAGGGVAARACALMTDRRTRLDVDRRQLSQRAV